MANKTLSITSWFSKMNRRRSFKQQRSTETPLHRTLTLSHLVFYAIGLMVGAGIYTLSAKVIRADAGPAASISYLIGAVSAIFTGLCYAEFGTIIPRAGSCYSYTYTVIGELPAFLVGWTMLSDSIIIMAAIAKAFSGTINTLTNDAISNWTIANIGRMAPEGSSGIIDDSPDLMALALIVILIVLTLSGAKTSLSFVSVITIIQVACLITITVGCFVYGSIHNWQIEGGFFPFGFSGILKGTGVIVFAFNGFDCLANASEEAINPRKTIPLALFISLIVVTILYVSSTLGMSYLVPRLELDYASPFVSGFAQVGTVAFYWIAAVGTILATGAAKICQMFIIPRMIYAMASDGLIFKWLAYVNESTGVPIWALLFGGSLSGLLAVFFRIEIITEMSSMGILISYLVVGLDLIILKYVFNLKRKNNEENDMKYEEVMTDERKNEKCDSNGFSSISERSDLSLYTEVTPLKIRPFATSFCNKFVILKRQGGFISILSIHLLSDFVLSLVIHFMSPKISVLQYIALCFTIVMVGVSFGLLCIYEPASVEGTFETPLMPLAPAMTILVNMIIIFKLSYLTWLRFLIWLAFGLLIYLFYGMSHSTANSSELDVEEECSDKYIKLDSSKDYGTTTPPEKEIAVE